MEIHEAIFNRRSVRAYKPDPIREAELKEILEAAAMAPSAANLQPWYFVAITSQEQMKALREIMSRVSEQVSPNLRKRFPEHPGVVEETQNFIGGLGSAPVCVLAFELRDDYGKPGAIIAQSVSAAIENMILEAYGKGIGSCWLTAPLEVGAGPEIRERFAPDKGRLIAVITLGYSDQRPKAPPRKAGRYIIL